MGKGNVAGSSGYAPKVTMVEATSIPGSSTIDVRADYGDGRLYLAVAMDRMEYPQGIACYLLTDGVLNLLYKKGSGLQVAFTGTSITARDGGGNGCALCVLAVE